MNIKHVWTILCEQCIVDENKKMISLINSVENLNVSIAPTDSNAKDLIGKQQISLPTKLCLVSYFYKTDSKRNENSKIYLTIDFVDPTGQLLKSNELEAELKDNMAGLRIVANIEAISIVNEGLYSFRIGVRDKKQNKPTYETEIPLKISIIINADKYITKKS